MMRYGQWYGLITYICDIVIVTHTQTSSDTNTHARVPTSQSAILTQGDRNDKHN